LAIVLTMANAGAAYPPIYFMPLPCDAKAWRVV